MESAGTLLKRGGIGTHPRPYERYRISSNNSRGRGGGGQELHASPHIEQTPILSYPYISIYGHVLSI